MTTCTKAQRNHHCPQLKFSEHIILVQRPVISSGKRRPRETLLYPVVVMSVLMRSVGGSRLSGIFGFRVDANETPLFKTYVAYLFTRTSAGGQFGWGGTPLKRYQRCPKVDSTRSEIE
jgi:hypothetical protein